MSTPAFGHSAGDFVATLQLITKIIAAFKDSGGASEEYRHLLLELETLFGFLRHLDSIRATDNNLTHVGAVGVVGVSCRKPL